MAQIGPDAVYTKTAKGVLEVGNKSGKLPRELRQICLSIDGKASMAELQPRSDMTAAQFQHAVQQLVSDGYIKVVAGRPQQAAASAAGELDFTSPQAMAQINMEAASRALAAADATKRAQAEARAALDARMRQESEARARALAEARANAEAEARGKAEDAARAALDERRRAEQEASTAQDAAARAEAEARARTAAAAVVRAEAEARVRGEAEERAKVLAESKRAAEEEARVEAETRTRNEEQAQARAAAEGRAREALEAQVQAMEGVRALAADPTAQEAEAARARVRELEANAEHAREAARASAEAEGRADEVPQPEMDIADRVRQLNARVQAARGDREVAARQAAADYEATLPPGQAEGNWPTLQLGERVEAVQPNAQPLKLDIPLDLDAALARPAAAPARAPTPEPAAEPEALPVVDLDRPVPVPIPLSPEHVPTALERVMAEMAARKQAAPQPAKPAAAQPIERTPEPVAEAPVDEAPAAEAPVEAEPAEKIVPTIDDTDPLNERLNIDRAAHDILAEGLEARRKAEAAQTSAAAIAARRHRMEEETRRETDVAGRKRRKQVLAGVGLATLIVPGLAIAYLQFTPLNGYIPEAQRALEARLNQPVSISTLRYVILPTPRLVLEGVAVGKSSGVRIERLSAHVMPWSVITSPTSFGAVEAHGVEIESDVLGTLPAWTGGRAAGALHTDRLNLSAMKVKLAGTELEPMDGEIAFATNGTIKEATFSSPKLKLELTPRPEGVRVLLTATDWQIPYGPPFAFGLLTVRGLIDQGQIAAAEYTGRVAGGSLEGALTARWSGPLTLQGEFKVDGARLQDLAVELDANFSAKGTVKATGRYSMQAPTWTTLTANPQVGASFVVTRGELTNLDLMRAIQSPALGALRGGRTGFEELSGTLQIGGGNYLFRQLQLTSGPLNANGTLDVAPTGQLNGRIVAELKARGARSTLLIGGTVQDPQLKR